jgi:hypothetical protein
MTMQRHTWKVLGAGLLAAAATACGSSGTPATSPSSSTPTSTATTPAATPSATSPTSSSASGATAAITTNWESFFNNKTPVAKRVSLLQDGSQFASIIQAQSHSSLASTATAKVVSVTNVTATQATVKYNILISGATALPGAVGTAVNLNGMWKVGATSFCGLLTLEQLKPLPAACKSAH